VRQDAVRRESAAPRKPQRTIFERPLQHDTAGEGS
jgi:hypothetical protein